MATDTDNSDAGGEAVPSAVEITVAQTLELLDGHFLDVSTGVADGRFAFWLGSGISRERVPDLRSMLHRVIAHLQDRIANDDSPGRFSDALTAILNLAQLSQDERESFDRNCPIREWPVRDVLLQRLSANYAKAMNVRVLGEPEDYLLWVAADVVSSFSSTGLEPDVEHLCLAVLALEGVAPVMVTANWDGLIELACAELFGAEPPLRVCILPQDIRMAEPRSSLFKIHGCAVRAAGEPDVYRDGLIVRQSQIDDWSGDAHRVLRDEAVGIALRKPTLMIGLSAQDANIRSVFVAAKDHMAWPWPPDSLAHVFAEDHLGEDQKAILQSTYGDAYPAHGGEIEQSALLRAFGKPLLTALVLQTFSLKLQAMIRLAIDTLTETDSEALLSGAVRLRDLAAASAEGDHLAYVRGLIDSLSRAMSLFVGLSQPSDSFVPYRPLSTTAVHELIADPTTLTDGRCEAAVALALVGLGCETGKWSILGGSSASPRVGAMRLVSEFGESAVFLAANPGVVVRLIQDGVFGDETGGAVVVQSGPLIENLRRSPVDSPGRTGSNGPRMVGMTEVLRDVSDLADLRDRFQREALL